VEADEEGETNCEQCEDYEVDNAGGKEQVSDPIFSHLADRLAELA
jgi:hypothetical protein